MHDGSGRIVVQGLSKQFGPIIAVNNLSFTVEPGSVTGFLGPNGAGKTTTLRMLLGLVRPTAGGSTINGLPFEQLGNPGRVVGAVLEAQGFHPTRTARNHLRVYATAMGVPDERADQVLALVGLSEAGHRAAGSFSLGMKQRLALATALLGDPQVLVLDEPANGLDPEGIAWLRAFLQSFARTGRTVLISSHLLAEVEQTVDQVVIISRGQTVYYGGLDYLRQSQQSRVLVQAADPQALVTKLQEAGVNAVEPTPDGRLAITGVDRKTVADTAMAAGIALYDIQQENVDLEQLFFRLTQGQYAGQQPPPGYGPPPGGGWGPPPGPGYGPPSGGYAAPTYAPPQGYPGTPPQGTPPGYAPPGYAPQGTPPQGYAAPQPGYAPPQDYVPPPVDPQQYQQQYQPQAAPPPEQPPGGGWGGNA
ncbi:ABC transporter ATP-binding protein [Kutzneria buriramensis]|uniref:ABC-2 type transport system ATP-binding protein n=1 Tax=Kutzneria buriramensis TaxID=1045776 RepID=A0A3E0ICI2_9PSEU|nr:ABC transporter ATP-binding protein [Kutzneria buriramensis]REH55885.1 ABC-2 type transport system ATP-binding protein [Kutzneria buriramensis]